MRTRYTTGFVLWALVAVVASSSSCSATSGEPHTCVRDEECPTGQMCINRACVVRDRDGSDTGAGVDSETADTGQTLDTALPDTSRPDTTRPDSGGTDTSLPDLCSPVTCADLGATCGQYEDGCGGPIYCGACAPGQTCDDTGTCLAAPADCAGITADPAYELCEEAPGRCAGVFTDGSGCTAFCAAAGMQCVQRFGGEPGCMLEAASVLTCGEQNGHMSDWCVCQSTTTVDPTCAIDPANPPGQRDLHYRQAQFSPRASWVLDCRDYAYTAQFAEHEACDSLYAAGSGRGTATFQLNAPRGTYDVYVEGRHTTNRNPSGALVMVTSAGQTYTATINQRDDAGLVFDLHGRYCLDGPVTVVMDSSSSGASDSVRSVRLVPAL